jgi:hypothetical protein
MNIPVRSALALWGIMLLASPAAPQTSGSQPGASAWRLQQGERGRPARGAPVPQQRPRPESFGAWQEDTYGPEEFPLAPGRTFQLVTVSGNVSITGANRNTVRVRAVKKVRHANRDAANALLQNIEVRVTPRGGGIEVLTVQPAANAPIEVDYDIEVPSRAGVYLRSHGGSVRIHNVKGDLEAEVAGRFPGDLTLTSVGRVRSAKATLGSITIDGSDGSEVKAEAMLNGDVLVRDVRRAEVIELRANTGAATLINSLCDLCRASTVRGRIDVSGPLKADSRYQLNSNFGEIRLAPADGPVGFDVEAVAAAGFKSDFQLREVQAAAPPRGTEIVRGVYGNGSAIISMRTFGRIRITKSTDPR